MKPLAYTLLRHFADGAFHSGEALARSVGASRASVWNAVEEIEAPGLAVFRIRGRGYRLAAPLSMLNGGELATSLAKTTPFKIELIDEVDSTNTLLLARAREGAPHATVIAAEWQRAGRGRMQRRWHALPAGSLTFSVLWRLARGAASLAGLSLAVGVALIRTLGALGINGAGLKWPNDVLWQGRKLAGILIEMQGDALGPAAVVIGIGVNVRLSEAARDIIDQPVTDVEGIVERVVDRNQLLAMLLGELHAVLMTFEQKGFAALRDEWQRNHVHQGRSVRLTLPDGQRANGVARGVAIDGALMVETARGVQPFHSGEVSVRATDASERV